MAPRKKTIEEVVGEKVLEPTPPESVLALASFAGGSVAPYNGNFYMPSSTDSLGQTLGVIPDKLIVPKEYHAVINMCYDFYQRGGIVATVVNRLTELSITTITNGQRKTSDEANEYFNSVLHRSPSRLNRFIHTAALEYFLSGMVLPKVEWQEVLGKDFNPSLTAGKTYFVPVVDLWPPKLVRVEWAGWGEKDYYIQVPDDDIRMIKRGDSNKIKEQQRKYKIWRENYPDLVRAVQNGEKFIRIDTDAILRKEVSYTEYPTPFLYNILEALVFKQQLRRMDYSVASRIINAILLVTEGSDEFPITQETRGNLDALKQQIEYYGRNPAMTQRLFPLFSNHTTKLQWIQPDVQAMMDQDKYREVNEEIGEGLGLAKILITGESRNAQASEVSTWAIQPMMEELREMFLEWLRPIYEEGAELNGFRYTPEPIFSPIRLQDFIKTAAVFAQAFKEGNLSRTTRDVMLGLNFESEVELMQDEKEIIEKADLGDAIDFPEMPYNVVPVPGKDGGIGGGLGRPAGSPKKGGRPQGSSNPAVNKRNRGIKPSGQSPVSRIAAGDNEPVMSDEEFIEQVSQLMEERGISFSLDNI